MSRHQSLDALDELAKQAHDIAYQNAHVIKGSGYYPIRDALVALQQLIVECRAHERADRSLLATMAASLASNWGNNPTATVRAARAILTEIDKEPEC